MICRTYHIAEPTRKTYIIEEGKIYYKDQLTSGWAVHISDIEECISAIQYQNKNKAFLKRRLTQKNSFNEAFCYVVKLIQERKEAGGKQAGS